MIGQLFTQYFLTEGITVTAEWEESCVEKQAFGAFKRSLSDILSKIITKSNPNESVTEQEVVRPILELLGWREYLPQQGADSNQIIPDHLLFADGEAKSRAMARANSTDAFQDALAIEESKRFGLPLDNRDQSDIKADWHSPRPDSAVSIGSGAHLRWAIALGHSDQRRRVAPL